MRFYVAPLIHNYIADDENPDLKDYRGYVDWLFGVGSKGGLDFWATLRKGSAATYGSVELNAVLSAVEAERRRSHRLADAAVLRRLRRKPARLPAQAGFAVAARDRGRVVRRRPGKDAWQAVRTAHSCALPASQLSRILDCPRPRFTWLRCCLPSRRRSFDARVGLVARRIFGSMRACVDHFAEALERIALVVLLRAKALRADDDDVVVGEPPARQRAQSRAHAFGQRRPGFQIATQLYGARDLVDVLTAGAAGSG